MPREFQCWICRKQITVSDDDIVDLNDVRCPHCGQLHMVRAERERSGAFPWTYRIERKEEPDEGS